MRLLSVSCAKYFIDFLNFRQVVEGKLMQNQR